VQEVLSTESCVLDGLRKGHWTENHCFVRDTCHSSSLVTVMPSTTVNCFCHCGCGHELNTGLCTPVVKDWIYLGSWWGQRQFLRICRQWMCRLVYPTSGSCVLIERVAGAAKKKKRETDVSLISAELYRRLHFLRNSASARLASMMYRTLWTWTLCRFFGNIGFQLNICQLQISFDKSDLHAGIKVTNCSCIYYFCRPKWKVHNCNFL
jgi:hypothetical protein